MKNKDGSKVDRGATDFDATTIHSHQLGRSFRPVDRENAVFLTCQLGTQPLLTECAPVYPLMKTAVFETEEMAQPQ